MIKKYDIKGELKQLKATGRLSTYPHIFCQKCATKVTAFGSNLESKIKKAGSLQKLLNNFECRACRKAEKVVAPKAPRKTKKASKVSKTAELIANLPKMQFSERKPIILVDNPEFARQVTAHACQRPDIFLDAGKTCDFCPLYNVCAAPCRALSKQGWQVGVAA